MLEELEKLGVDTAAGIGRLAGNASLYVKMLIKFYSILKASTVAEGFARGDRDGLIRETHALKGNTGNLSITPLFEAYDEIVRLLREDKLEQAEAVFKKILPVQEAILDCISQYIE